MQKISCHHCKNAWEFDPPIGRRDICPSCKVDSKVCLNCKFYDANAYRQCRENQAEWVKEKKDGNFCSYFFPIESQKNIHEDPNKKKLESLFQGHLANSPSPKSSASLSQDLENFLKKKS